MGRRKGYIVAKCLIEIYCRSFQFSKEKYSGFSKTYTGTAVYVFLGLKSILIHIYELMKVAITFFTEYDIFLDSCITCFMENKPCEGATFILII